MRERPLFLSRLVPVPLSRLMERTGERTGTGRKALFLLRQRGRPGKYPSYDVGGTMGSPYSFQVSGR